MNINPISSTNYNNTNFKSKIVQTKLLQEGIKAAKNNIERAEYKSMECARKFVNNLDTVQLSKKAKEVSFDVDEVLHKGFVTEDGKKVMEYEFPEKYCLGYVAAQLLQKYADALNIDKMPTLLDQYKLRLDMVIKDYHEARNNYQVHLDTMLSDFTKNLV